MALKHSIEGKRPPGQGGFTIVELMIIVAIVSVLAIVALPVYLDYAVRSKVSEALVFLSEAKTNVSNAYYTSHEMPTNNTDAGLRDPDNYDAYDYIRKLEVVGGPSSPDPDVTVAGSIVATLKLPGTTSDGRKLVLEPVPGDGEVGWICRTHPTDGVETRRVPGDCRN